MNPDVTLSLTTSRSSPQEATERSARLLELLVACAKQVSKGNLNRADAYLSQIMEFASVSGDSMQRLSTWFGSALAVRLVKRWPGLHKALILTKQPDPQSVLTPCFPFLGFAYSIIGQSLVRAMSMDPMVHIVDIGSGDLELWIPILRGLAEAPAGPPHLKVTCVSCNKHILERLGHGLAKEASTLNMPFQFFPLNVHLRNLPLNMLNVGTHEALAIVSSLSLHELLAEDDRIDVTFGAKKSNSSTIRECRPMDEFLAKVRSLNPKAVFVVEQEADHNKARLMDRFGEGLRYYSAVFDSLDAIFGSLSTSNDRLALEEMFGREIEDILSCEGLERLERHERLDQWAARMARVGFKPVRLWAGRFGQDDKYMAAINRHEGYKIVSERYYTKICWHECAIYAISAWTC